MCLPHRRQAAFPITPPHPSPLPPTPTPHLTRYPNNAGSRSDVDQFGRAIIDTTKWPSAAGGKGFKPLADRLHAMGFKLGIHVMHGVPVGALASPPPTVKGTQIPVPSIKSDELCPWNKNWYKVDMTRPGAQDYYNSIYAQYAAWEIDFIKNDWCVAGAVPAMFA